MEPNFADGPGSVPIIHVLIGGALVGLATSVHMFTYQQPEDPQRGLIAIIQGNKSATSHTACFLLGLVLSGLVLGNADTFGLYNFFGPQLTHSYDTTQWEVIRTGFCYGVGAAWSGGLRFFFIMLFNRYSWKNVVAVCTFVLSGILSAW